MAQRPMDKLEIHYTPKHASWLKWHIQRVLAQRALAGQTPANAGELIEWLETTARAWNADPTPVRNGATSTSSTTRVSPPPSTRRIRSLYTQTNPTPTPVHGTMAKFRSS